MFSTGFHLLRVVFVAASVALATGLQAQATEFKTVTLKVGYGAGGNYDLTSRLVARHLGRFLPGNPAVVVQNVPGGGSLKLTKMMLGSEPADGSVIASVSEAMPFAPVLDPANADFDPLSMQWIGSLSKEPSICITTKNSGIDTMDKFLESDFLLGASGKSSLTYIFAALVKNGLNAKFGIVTGFDGSAEIVVASQRGEIAGVCALVYHNVAERPGEFNVIGMFGPGTIPAAPTLPRFSDKIKDPVARQAAVLIESSRSFHLPLIAPPGTPAETLDALRKAYADMAKDPEFLADAARLSDLTIKVTTGEEIARFVADQLKADPAVFEAARNLAK
jgi:tripartite-type tricarboxylate transporter receptor subunit TctC